MREWLCEVCAREAGWFRTSELERSYRACEECGHVCSCVQVVPGIPIMVPRWRT